MNISALLGYEVTLKGVQLTALPSGALWWKAHSTLCVSDLHLGKSERIARRGGAILPPYETQDTLDRLSADLEATNAKTVICLGDSFDDLSAAQAMPDAVRLQISQLQAGRHWVWIQGNHDPGPVEFGGTHMAEFKQSPIVFRHIAQNAADGEISGHYHPKARIHTRARAISRPAFLVDDRRMILPAYGTYTGGLWSHDPLFDPLFKPRAIAILTGKRALAVPMPRSQRMPASSN
ncbi:MAG: ligase-associated DNA damage response endonuclease PdeM [Aliishimia sp.]